MYLVALARLLAGCSTAPEAPEEPVASSPSPPVDSGAAPLTVTLLDPATFEPLSDGDDAAVQIAAPDFFWYLAFALDIWGSSGTAEVNPTVTRDSDGTVLTNLVSDGDFLLEPLESGAFRLASGRAILLVNNPTEAAALAGEVLTLQVDVTDLMSGAASSADVTLTAVATTETTGSD